MLGGSCFCKPSGAEWFDGYDGREVLILDDLRKSTFTFSYLLDVLDRYEFGVEVKGGYVPMLAKVMIITCNQSHEDSWGTAGRRRERKTRAADAEDRERVPPPGGHGG